MMVTQQHKKLVFILSLLISFMFTDFVSADPIIISDISGAVSEGSSIIITGSGFSTNSAVGTSNLEWVGDNIENGTVGNAFSKSGWSVRAADSSSAGTLYSTSDKHSGSQSLNIHYSDLDDPDNDKYKGYFIYGDAGTNLGTVYITYWVKASRDSGSEGQWKFTRISHSNATTDQPCEFYIKNWNKSDGNSWGLATLRPYDNVSSNWLSDGGTDSVNSSIGIDEDLMPGGSNSNWNKWVRVEFYIVPSSQGSENGTFQYWFHEPGVKIVNTINYDGNLMIHGASQTDRYRYVVLGHYAGDGLTGVNTWWDDVFIQKGTQARVEIGNASTWSACTHREIQIPTAWSDNFITITANQGSFADEENVYLFVVDADGILSAGYGPITFGSGEKGDDTTPPGDVTDLTIQAGDGQIAFSWINPMDSDFKGTMIRYRTDGIYPTNNSDGIEVCNKTASPGTSDTYILTGLSNGTIYYFSVFTYDETGNYSETVHISAMPCANVYTKTFGDISSADFPKTCKDTYLNAGEAEVTYLNNSESLNTYTWPTNTAANRIVMKWDLSALPQDAIIQEATLSLYMYSYRGDDNYEIAAHKIINHNPDISSCTWNTYDGSNSWTGGVNGGEQDMASAESSTIVDKTSGYKNWNITQMVQEWVDNSSTNFGLMLNSDTTAASDSNRYFRPSEYSNQDQRPVLTIKCCGIEVSIPSTPTGLGVKVGD